MVRLTTPESLLAASEPETALSASDFRYLHRALLWLLILFAVTAATTLVIDMPTLLFAGMQCYLSWSAIAALIQYLFLRIEAKDLRAAFIHEFGAFFVIFNSARLLRFEGKST
jgi:hypothetical protein